MKNKRGFMILVFFIAMLTLFIFASLVSAKTLEVNLLVQGLEPVQDVEIYEGYPVYYILFTNYSVSLYDLQINENNIEEIEEKGNFKAQLISPKRKVLYETFFQPEFIILSDPPTETDVSMATLSFPYSDKAKYLKVYWQNDLKLETEISNLLCNKNKKCDSNENFYSCSDCKWFSNDSLCLSYSNDLYCDYDCYNDTDCYIDNCNDGRIGNDKKICHTGNCFDKKKNGNEEGADCGGRCMNECPTITETTGGIILGKIIGEIKERVKIAGNVVKKWFD